MSATRSSVEPLLAGLNGLGHRQLMSRLFPGVDHLETKASTVKSTASVSHRVGQICCILN